MESLLRCTIHAVRRAGRRTGVRKLGKQRLSVDAGLSYGTSTGGDDGALSPPPGGGLLLCWAAVARRCAALRGLVARSREGGWGRVARWRQRRRPRLCHRLFTESARMIYILAPCLASFKARGVLPPSADRPVCCRYLTGHRVASHRGAKVLGGVCRVHKERAHAFMAGARPWAGP